MFYEAHCSRATRARVCNNLPLLAAFLLLGGWPCVAQEPPPTPRRPIVGLALGGGSARGFAYIGVIRWLEEHRIPIDRIAGTSVGGLVGGAYATGISPTELESLVRSTDWDEVFGGSTYRFKTVARKEDARAYPSHLELHLGGGVSLPPALNRGQQVDLLLERLAGLYSGPESFDSLPTPFRCVAVDLRTGALVVLEEGSLPLAMRATMSLPGVFPPVRVGESVLVDGGAMNNLPADIVRSMGADVVIAVRVGQNNDTSEVATDLLSVTERTMTAVMRANTRRAASHADVVVNAAANFNGSDWRRGRDLVEEGYRAAEAMRKILIQYAMDAPEWKRFQARRVARRRTTVPLITRVEVRGATPGDARLIHARLRSHVSRGLSVGRLEADITRLESLDRYTALRWELTPEEAGSALVIVAEPLVTAPPFLMTSLNVRRGAAEDYSFQLALRYLAYDLPLSGSQLRVDLGLGTDPHLATELRQALGGSSFFAAVGGAARRSRLDLFRDDDPIAQYEESRLFAELDLGVVAFHSTEARVGIRGGYYAGRIEIGDPALPEVSGPTTEIRLRTIHDTQDNAVVPTRGVRLLGTVRQVLIAPEAEDPAADGATRGLAQAELEGSHFWSWRHATRRVFLVGGAGTSFDGDPQLPDQFKLGLPMRLGGFAPGQRSGAHFATLTGGYLQTLGRLPDFVGGPILGGAWLENGSAFDSLSEARYEAQVGFGVIAETLVGPAWFAVGLGHSTRSFSLGFGSLFR